MQSLRHYLDDRQVLRISYSRYQISSPEDKYVGQTVAPESARRQVNGPNFETVSQK